MDPLVDISLNDSSVKKVDLTISTSSLSQAVKATIPSRRRKYDTSQAIEDFYRKHAASLREGVTGLHEKVAFGIFSIYKPRIIKIARKYRSLSPIFGEDDLQQEALIAILQALRKYKHSSDIKMKFSTYLEWSIRNIFQRAIGNRDKYVEIYGRDGAFEKTMGYSRFVEQKKELEHEGRTYTTKRRFCYLSEIVLDEDLEAKLNEANLAPREYTGSSEISEDPIEEQETETSEESAEEEQCGEPATTEPLAQPNPNNGSSLQMIDGVYRQWVRSYGRSCLIGSDPLVFRIYELCRQDGEAFPLPSTNNGTSISAEDVQRSMISAITQALARHDDDSVPKIPFSVSLRVAMKKSMQTLRKEERSSQKGGFTQWMSER